MWLKEAPGDMPGADQLRDYFTLASASSYCLLLSGV
ncbi:MAG: hypothetical protein K0R39_380 [Symbiobacteriaceae bacterium]|nr:hypothetical protein [Symbiobacteriaceae bacterium]